jgi:hypothetical protein
MTMGHSILEVGASSATFYDTDLQLVLRLVQRELSAEDKGPKDALFADCEEAAAMSAPGCVDFPLERYASDSAGRTLLLSLLERIEASVSGSPWIPLERLKSDRRIWGVFFGGPYPSARVLGAVRQLQSLIVSGAVSE